jgi:hypothetical protein
VCGGMRNFKGLRLCVVDSLTIHSIIVPHTIAIGGDTCRDDVLVQCASVQETRQGSDFLLHSSSHRVYYQSSPSNNTLETRIRKTTYQLTKYHYLPGGSTTTATCQQELPSQHCEHDAHWQVSYYLWERRINQWSGAVCGYKLVR